MNGGEVKKSKNDYVKTQGPQENIPFRVYPGGLSVSRAFGDYNAKTEKHGGKPGVLIAEPEIFDYDLDQEKWD